MASLLAVLFASFVFLFPAEAKFSKSKVKREEKKLERDRNPHDSGIGALRVQVLLARYLAKEKRKAKTKSCKRKFQRAQKKAARKSARFARLRKAYSFRGRWKIFDINPPSPAEEIYEFHFTTHNQLTDFIAGNIHTKTGVFVADFGGYQRFQRASATSTSERFKFSVWADGGKEGSPTLNGNFRDQFVGITLSVGGPRIASPFD